MNLASLVINALLRPVSSKFSVIYIYIYDYAQFAGTKFAKKISFSGTRCLRGHYRVPANFWHGFQAGICSK